MPIQRSGAAESAQLRRQDIVCRFQMQRYRLQIRDRDIRDKLAGKQKAGHAGEKQQKHDRNNAYENIGHDQPMAQPPHDQPVCPTEGKPKRAECEDESKERRKAAQAQYADASAARYAQLYQEKVVSKDQTEQFRTTAAEASAYW